MNEATVQLPRQMSTLAAEVDATYYYIFWLSVILFVAIIGASVVFLIKYRASKNPQSTPPGHHDVLELVWTFAPLILLIPMFHYGFKGYVNAMVSPAGALEVRVKAKQWAWDFYQPGQSEPVPGELVVPVNQPMKMIMSSEDVLHSFFVPEFRVKRDVVPGMYTSLWFEATEITSTVDGEGKPTGNPVDMFCTEYCGRSHSQMLAKVHIVSAEDYKKYIESLDKAPNIPPEEWGKELYTKNGCNACHSTDGTRLVGPSFKGLFGKKEPIVGMGPVDVDENYLRESILRPQAKIVEGFGGANMPPFVLKDNKLDAIIAYIKSLK
jgi:cytochrome c oxidase subunit 2